MMEPKELTRLLAFSQATPEERVEQLASGTAFPECQDKPATALELQNGETIEGVFQTYRPAALRFWIKEGVVDVPFSLVPPDIQNAFPQDASVSTRAQAAELTRKAAALAQRMQEQDEEEAALMVQIREDIATIFEALGEDCDLVERLSLRLTALGSETRALERSLIPLLRTNATLRLELERLRAKRGYD